MLPTDADALAGLHLLAGSYEEAVVVHVTVEAGETTLRPGRIDDYPVSEPLGGPGIADSAVERRVDFRADSGGHVDAGVKAGSRGAARPEPRGLRPVPADRRGPGGALPASGRRRPRGRGGNSDAAAISTTKRRTERGRRATPAEGLVRARRGAGRAVMVPPRNTSDDKLLSSIGAPYGRGCTNFFRHDSDGATFFLPQRWLSCPPIPGGGAGCPEPIVC